MKAQANYWDRAKRSRLSRRRALAGAAMLGAASALLAACGGGGSTKTASQSQGRVSKPSDSSKQAKKGGIIQADVASDEPNLDPLSTARVNGGSWSPYCYNRPLQEKVAPGGPEAAMSEGDR